MSLFTLKKISPREARNVRLILLGFIAFGILSVSFYPLNIFKEFFPGSFNEDSACIMLNVFGIPCPFCGMSHAFFEFLGMNFERSIYYNPSSVIFFTFIGIACLSIFVLSLFDYKISITFTKRTLYISLLVLSVIWILNICFGHRH